MLRMLSALGLAGGLLLLAPSAASADAGNCTSEAVLTGGCSVDASLGDGNATLEGTTGSPGSAAGAGGSGAPSSSGASGSGTGSGGSGGSAPVDPAADCIYLLNGRCYAMGPGKSEVVRPITLADIAQFRPDPGVDRMEPDGWMVVGLDTNFFASSGVQVLDGALLGQPAAVRFTPVAWHWAYGDGATRTSGTPGAPWAAQRLREFDPTATSHVYRAPGTYVIDLTIDFAAEYRFGAGSWLDIPGVLPVPANRLIATAGSAKTVLVERECTINPAGPGC